MGRASLHGLATGSSTGSGQAPRQAPGGPRERHGRLSAGLRRAAGPAPASPSPSPSPPPSGFRLSRLARAWRAAAWALAAAFVLLLGVETAQAHDEGGTGHVHLVDTGSRQSMGGPNAPTGYAVPAVTLTGANTAVPSFTAPAVRTDLEFSLTVNDGVHDSPADTVTVRVRPPLNPTSAPCAHPVTGGQQSAETLVTNIVVTDSTISFQGEGTPSAEQTFWFCRPDGTRTTLAEDVAGTHSETVSALASGTTYWVTADWQTHGPVFRTGWTAVTTTGGASIVRVAFANAPASDGTYVLGETIRATVTWSMPVTVDTKGANDNVHLRLDVGPDDANYVNSRKVMAYVSGSGTDTLTFAYAVQPGDMDPDGVWVQTESAIAHNLVVRANGATIRNGATDAGNVLSGLPTTGDAGRKVDGTSTATAAAGDDREVLTGAAVTLAGSGSSTRTGATLAYRWRQTGGQTVTLDDATSATPSFTAPAVRTDLAFSLTVNDGVHDSPADTVTVRVRPPPNPTSAPCAHPAPPGTAFWDGNLLGPVTSGDSSISFKGTGLGTALQSYWFCRPDGTRTMLAEDVSSNQTVTVPNLASGTTYWVAADWQTTGDVFWNDWRAFTTTGAATIKRVAFANAPTTGDTYRYILGDIIRATVTWSRPVTVDAKGANANVLLRLDLGPDDANRGNSQRLMAYVSGSGTDTLTFEYAVRPGDTDPDGVWVQTESAISDNLVAFANGATIRNGTTDAGNTLSGLPTTGDASRKVDGSTTLTADAGEDQEVLTGASVTLSGSGLATRPNPVWSYRWREEGARAERHVLRADSGGMRSRSGHGLCGPVSRVCAHGHRSQSLRSVRGMPAYWPSLWL